MCVVITQKVVFECGGESHGDPAQDSRRFQVGGPWAAERMAGRWPPQASAGHAQALRSQDTREPARAGCLLAGGPEAQVLSCRNSQKLCLSLCSLPAVTAAPPWTLGCVITKLPERLRSRGGPPPCGVHRRLLCPLLRPPLPVPLSLYSWSSMI